MRLLVHHPFKHLDYRHASALLGTLILAILVFVYRNSLHKLEGLGYAGVFLISLIGNATIVLPAPVLVFVFAAGATLPSPLLVGLVAGVGATIGELTGYVAGYGSSTLVEQNKTYNQIKSWIERFGLWAIGVLAFIPNPFFDIAGFVAGTMGMRLRWFLAATFVGKVLKTTLVAYAGSLSIKWVETFFL